MDKHDIRIIVLLSKGEKDKLEKEANHRGLPLGSYCRMLLIQSFNGNGNDELRRSV